MAFDVSALANYTKENEALLVTSSVLGSKTASLIKSQGNVMVGVKSAETINIMDTDAIFQSGGTCGFNASGSTTFTQRTVTVGKIKVNESLCPKDLEAKYLEMSVRAALGNDDARAYVRAADDTTSNNAGLIPTRQLTEVINPLANADRPAVDSVSRGVLPDAGMSFEIPKLTAVPTVGEEAEEATIDETGMTSEFLSVSVKKYAGGQEFSREQV